MNQPIMQACTDSIEETIKNLVVDDSRLIRAQACDLIKSLDDKLEVYGIENAREALKFTEEKLVDIVVLDIIMPEISGIEVLKHIKQNPSTADITILMFSSINDKKTLEECFELGADDYILKPLERVEFLARFKSVLREKYMEKQILKQMKTLVLKNESLKQLYLELGETQTKLVHQEKLAGIGQLAAGVAHEINNPLGYVSSNIDTLEKYCSKFLKIVEQHSTLLDKVLEEKNNPYYFDANKMYEMMQQYDLAFFTADVAELFEDTFDGMNRIKKIVAGLRNFSRIDLVSDYEEYDLNEGIENTMIIIQNALKYCAEINIKTQPIPYIEAIGSEINQVLLNLLINARDAIEEKYKAGDLGKINIETSRINDHVRLIIQDNGAGIPNEIRSEIFNPFFTEIAPESPYRACPALAVG